MFPVSDVIPSRSTPFVTVGLIVLNSLAFLYEWQLGDRELERFLFRFGAVPAYLSWSSILTSMFLHSGWLHFGGNMLYLWIFGDNVEDRFGHLSFLAFYLFCGALAVFGQVWVTPYSLVPMIGASGAIAGVMGAYFVLYPQSRVLTAVFVLFFLDLIEIPAVFFLGIWFLMQLFNGVGSIDAAAPTGGVAFWAHIAGFVTGVACGAFRRYRDAGRGVYW
jgi:membrane associated rhomboid family serine protease